MSEPRKRKEKNVNVKKENSMGHGIGPQNLGAAGMSTKSKPCGTPLDFNKNLSFKYKNTSYLYQDNVHWKKEESTKNLIL